MADPEDHLRGGGKEAAESCSQAAATQQPPGQPRSAATRDGAGSHREGPRTPGSPCRGPRRDRPLPEGLSSPAPRGSSVGAGCRGAGPGRLRLFSPPALPGAGPPLATRRAAASPAQSPADGVAPRRGIANRGSAPIHPPAGPVGRCPPPRHCAPPPRWREASSGLWEPPPAWQRREPGQASVPPWGSTPAPQGGEPRFPGGRSADMAASAPPNVSVPARVSAYIPWAGQRSRFAGTPPPEASQHSLPGSRSSSPDTLEPPRRPGLRACQRHLWRRRPLTVSGERGKGPSRRAAHRAAACLARWDGRGAVRAAAASSQGGIGRAKPGQNLWSGDRPGPGPSSHAPRRPAPLGAGRRGREGRAGPGGGGGAAP